MCKFTAIIYRKNIEWPRSFYTDTFETLFRFEAIYCTYFWNAYFGSSIWFIGNLVNPRFFLLLWLLLVQSVGFCNLFYLCCHPAILKIHIPFAFSISRMKKKIIEIQIYISYFRCTRAESRGGRFAHNPFPIRNMASPRGKWQQNLFIIKYMHGLSLCGVCWWWRCTAYRPECVEIILVDIFCKQN